MEFDILQSESETLEKEVPTSSFIGETLALVSLSASKLLFFILLTIIIGGAIIIAYFQTSLMLLALLLSFSLLSFFLGSLATGLKFSSGLEIAKLHLEEASEVIREYHRDNTENHEIKTGIPAIDSLYKLAENAAIGPEEELNRVKAELDLVLNNVAAAVILYGEDGDIKFCSPYIQVLTGYTNQQLQTNAIELTGSENVKDDFFKNIILEEDWQRYKRARLVSHLGEDSLVRFRIKHQSGLTLWLESRMVPIINYTGEVDSVMAITIDVTDSINYQKQIEEQNQDLNDFAYMVSHDLKAPIFTIHGMADALRDDYTDSLPDEAVELLTFITDAAKRLDKLVASVLEYSALSNSNESQTDLSLNETMSQVLSDYKEQLKGLDAKFTIPNDMPTVRGDPIRIYQVFSNLIGNAIKYREKSRSLHIQIFFRLLPPHLVEIEVRDNGLGIPEHKTAEIFRPYRRAHGADIEGSGVGLACVKKILEKLGGEVHAKSIEGQGSSFFLTLPLSKPARRAIPEDLERIF